MKFIQVTLHNVLAGLCAAVYCALLESIYLAAMYASSASSYFFVLKILFFYCAVGVGLGLLFSVLLRKSIAWVVLASFAFLMVGSFMIVDREVFYYDFSPIRVMVLVVVYALILGLFFVGWRKLSRPIFLVGTLIPFGVMSLLLWLGNAGQPTDKSNALIHEVQANAEVLPLSSRPNIMVIILDALDARHVSYLGYERKTTEFLDSLSSESVVFSNFNSPDSTGPSIATLFTGMTPATLDLNFADDRLPEKYFTLGELAKSAGYDTIAIAWTYYIDSIFGFGQGFGEFQNLSRVDPAGYCYLKRGLWHVYKRYFPLRKYMQKLEVALAKAYDPKEDAQDTRQQMAQEEGSLTLAGLDPDQIIVNRFFDWVDQDRQTPFFSFLHFQGGHDPYVVPNTHTQQFIKQADVIRAEDKMSELILGHEIELEDVDLVWDLYDSRLHFVDSVMRDLYAGLEARGLAQDTMIILMGDHGATINVVNLRAQDDFSQTDNWETSLAHPYFMVHYPKQFLKGKVVKEKYLSTDVLATLAEYLQINLPYPTEGNSFLSELINA